MLPFTTSFHRDPFLVFEIEWTKVGNNNLSMLLRCAGKLFCLVSLFTGDRACHIGVDVSFSRFLGSTQGNPVKHFV